jgi:hypothetical protein
MTLTAHHLNLWIIYWDVLHSKLHYCIFNKSRWMNVPCVLRWSMQIPVLWFDIISPWDSRIQTHSLLSHTYNDHGAKKHWLQRHNVSCQEISICQLTHFLLFLTKSCDSISWSLNACRISSMLLHTRWLDAWQSMGPSLDATSEVGRPTIASSNVMPVIALRRCFCFSILDYLIQ